MKTKIKKKMARKKEDSVNDVEHLQQQLEKRHAKESEEGEEDVTKSKIGSGL